MKLLPAVFLSCLSISALASPPVKGYKNVKFGMTLEQVKKTLDLKNCEKGGVDYDEYNCSGIKVGELQSEFVKVSFIDSKLVMLVFFFDGSYGEIFTALNSKYKDKSFLDSGRMPKDSSSFPDYEFAEVGFASNSITYKVIGQSLTILKYVTPNLKSLLQKESDRILKAKADTMKDL